MRTLSLLSWSACDPQSRVTVDFHPLSRKGAAKSCQKSRVTVFRTEDRWLGAWEVFLGQVGGEIFPHGKHLSKLTA